MNPTRAQRETITKIATIPQIITLFPSSLAFSSSVCAMNFTMPQKNTRIPRLRKNGISALTKSITRSIAPSTPDTAASVSTGAKIPMGMINLYIIHEVHIRTDRTNKEFHYTEHRYHNEHSDHTPEHTTATLLTRFFVIGIPDIRNNTINKIRHGKCEHHRNDRIQDLRTY